MAGVRFRTELRTISCFLVKLVEQYEVQDVVLGGALPGHAQRGRLFAADGRTIPAWHDEGIRDSPKFCNHGVVNFSIRN